MSLRQKVTSISGAPAVSSRDVHGGMTPGPAAILGLTDGRQIFVKAVPSSAPGSYRAYEREAVALGALPAAAPAPVLIGTAEIDGWLALIMSAVPGEPAGPPWDDEGARLVARACAAIGSLPAPGEVPRIGELLTDLDGWDRIEDHDEWEREHAPMLARLARRWPEWTAGPSLVHQDVRADNALIGEEATLVDWSFGCAGASWLDGARLAADVVAAGHRDGPEAALRLAERILAGLPDGASRFVVALAGMWRHRSTLPPLAGLPTLRGWQAARARALRPLLERLTA
ncbi:phosphotransferase family protein [Paractinoplanes atraurantiacus]|uniref:Phosphotransferase enzyme family protein n=1 Tax=Paractinoplanes atraurantiacus TaxID=1036182 RepID=A0A285IBY9_9ACTN|nr:phosphotransferase [Actinoplanes atraurantiacus]SNY44461.1 Phosphotransferase enzyme family protein [Actinoplanes atraurantiacus]